MRLEANPLPGIALPPSRPSRRTNAADDAVRVLLLEDSPSDALLISETLQDCPGRFAVTHVERLAAAVEYIAHHETDVVLCDLGLPDARGLDAALGLLSVAPALALIVMTRNNDDATAAEALRQGAQDYLLKDHLSGNSILKAISFAIRRRKAQAEIERARSRQFRLRDDFLLNASNDLRSPLSAIQRFAGILADEISGSLNGYADGILKNTTELSGMIDNLLEVSRIQTGRLIVEPQCIFLEGCISDSVRSFETAAEAKSIRLSVELDADLPPACADPQRVQQILKILLANAVRSTSAGGEVRVRVRLNPQDADFLMMEVSDTGCGIEPEVLRRIFTPLPCAPAEGSTGRGTSGLGLYLCCELVSRQGGEVRVESDPGTGAIFRFTLPVYSPGNLPDSIM